jgi:AcrR family transcriptional regulator
MRADQVHPETTAEPRPIGSGGKRLDRSRDAAIFDAALEGLAEVGYDRLTMDSIASRAHAGKGALYRRWPSKAALVVDAIIAWREQVAPLTAMEDTGSLRGDLEALLSALPNFDDAARRLMAVFAGLVSAAVRDPELKALVENHVLQRPRQVVEMLLTRAVARGEISTNRPLGLVPDLIVGLNFIHMMSGSGSDRDYIRRVFDEVVIPLVSSPEPHSKAADALRTERGTP